MTERQRKELREIIRLLERDAESCRYYLELDEENHTPQTFEQAIKELQDVLKDINGLLNQARETFKN
jgi:exonuclease VII small subunit